MSLTGEFVDAPTACAWGLVNEVVPHADLLQRATELGRAIAESDRGTVTELRRMYDALAFRADEEAYREEARWSAQWMRERFDAGSLSARRDRIVERGAAQQ